MSYQGFGKASGPARPPKEQPSFGNFPSPPPPSLFSDAPPIRTLSGPEVFGKFQSSPLDFQSTGPPPSFYNPSAGFNRPLAPSRLGGEERGLFVGNLNPQTDKSLSAIKSVGLSPDSESITYEDARFQVKRTRSPPLIYRDEEILGNSGQAVLKKQVESVFSAPTSENRPNFSGYDNLKTPQDQSFSGYYDSGRSFPREIGNVQPSKRTRSPPLPSSNDNPRQDYKSAQNNSKRPSTSPPRRGSRINDPCSSLVSQIDQRSLPFANSTPKATSIRPTSSPVTKRTRSPFSSDQVFQGNSYSSQDDTEREMQAKAKRLARFKVELNHYSSDIAEGKAAFENNQPSMGESQKHISNNSMEVAGDDNNIVSDYEGMDSSSNSIILGVCPDMCPESERVERERKGDLDQYERLDGDRNQTNKSLAVKKYNRTAEREASLIRPMPILQKTMDYLLNLLNQPYNDRFLSMYNFLWDRMRAIRMDLRMQHIFNEDAITMLEQMIRLHIIAMHELCEYSKGEGFSEGFDAHLNIEQMNKTSVELFQMYDDHRKKGINVPTEKEFRGYYALLKLDKHPGYKVEPAELSLDLAKMTPEMRQTPEILFARDVARACRNGNFIVFFRLARKASYLQACLMHAHFAKLRTLALASLHSGLQNNQGLPVAHVAKWLGMEEEDIYTLVEYHGFAVKEYEEPYMVKEGLFLNSAKDYPTKCSNLVHKKKSRMIFKDASSPSYQALPSHAEAAKLIQFPKRSKEQHKTAIPSSNKFFINAISATDRENSVREIHEETPKLKAHSTPKEYRQQVQQVIEKRVVGQLHENAHPVNLPLQWGFPSPGPVPTFGIVGRTNYDGLFKKSPDIDIPFGMERVPTPVLSKAVIQDKTPDHLFKKSPVRNMSFGMERISSPTVSKPALQDRSNGGNNSYVVEDSAPKSSTDNIVGDEELPCNHQEDRDNEVAENHQDEEIAVAKLKLIFRLWRRLTLRKRQLREERLVAANVALDSLSLGPPINLRKDQRSTPSKFDIDHAMRERQRRQEISSSVLNVSDVVADSLSQRNPEAQCLCWKIVVCSQINDPVGNNPSPRKQIGHLAAGHWLLSKITPSRETSGLLFSSIDLSIWRKWVSDQLDRDPTCCLSIVKGANFDNLNETVSGASAILFVVSESIPLKLQKAQLHSLLMSVPSGSSLPLLILSGLYTEEMSDPYPVLESELGLYDMDKSRISKFKIVSLVTNREVEHLTGFFSSDKLRVGLQWLANESPLQPVPCRVKTLELVLSHLNSSLNVLGFKPDHDVGPNNCISAFNEALDQSVVEISSTIEANPCNWPCPEIAFLEECSHEEEYMRMTRGLPMIGWSSRENVDRLIFLLRDLKLPTFPDELSFLTSGSETNNEIEMRREELETCLIGYLVKSNKLMGLTLATKEACVMLQRCSRLELHSNSSYFIIPRWVMIFRRIFNWRLTGLAAGPHSWAYILDSCHIAPQNSEEDIDMIGLTYHLNQPTLDEMIVAVTVESERICEDTDTSDHLQNKDDFMFENNKVVPSEEIACLKDGMEKSGREIVVGERGKKEESLVKLSKLLEQCNILQNEIDDKLSVYF